MSLPNSSQYEQYKHAENKGTTDKPRLVAPNLRPEWLCHKRCKSVRSDADIEDAGSDLPASVGRGGKHFPGGRGLERPSRRTGHEMTDDTFFVGYVDSGRKAYWTQVGECDKCK